LRETFRSWATLATAVRALASDVPLARDGVPAADALARIGAVGLAALDRLAGTIVPAPEWRDSARAVLDSAARPQGLLRLAVVDMVRWLVELAPIKP
jgi:hypothetical protein